MTKTSAGLSLYEEFKQRNPDLQYAGFGPVTDVGASIFAAHVRADFRDHLTRTLGGLTWTRSEKSLGEPIVIAEVSANTYGATEEGRSVAGAVRGLIDRLVDIEAVIVPSVISKSIEGAQVQEAQLINGPYVSVLTEGITKAVLSPSPMLVAK